MPESLQSFDIEYSSLPFSSFMAMYLPLLASFPPRPIFLRSRSPSSIVYSLLLKALTVQLVFLIHSFLPVSCAYHDGQSVRLVHAPCIFLPMYKPVDKKLEIPLKLSGNYHCLRYRMRQFKLFPHRLFFFR